MAKMPQEIVDFFRSDPRQVSKVVATVKVEEVYSLSPQDAGKKIV